MKYLLVDTSNMFFRARHVAARGADSWSKVGMSLHITFNALLKTWRQVKPDHVIFCLEGRSWRKDYYPPYKRNRAEARSALTEKEAAEDKLFWETFDTFKDFVREKTNCTVMQHPQLEADDLIAGWIQSHPDDSHIIISTDSDFVQLIAPNVKQYNGVSNTLITHEGHFTDKGKPVFDNKTNKPKETVNPEWLLFEKCMRGDPTDNVFSAYPKIRKNKLQEAFEDRKNKGFVWNNMMLQRWVDHEGVEHRVLDDYDRNRRLIDLTAQPDDIKGVIKETITINSVAKNVDQVGLRLMKFCGQFDLVKISEQAQAYAEPLNAKYPEKTNV